MKYCMVACINIPYWENWSAAASAVGGSQKSKFSVNFFFCKLTPNGLKCVKNTKLLTRLPPPTNFPFRVCYTSYHTTFHQNLSINVKFFIIILGNQFFDLKPPHNQEEANKKNLAELVHLFQSY